MIKNKSSFAIRCLRNTGLTLSLVLACLSIKAQETPAPTILMPEEAIDQSRNKGVETWEGTLFGQDSYKPGSYAQIEVVPNPGFEFETWEGSKIAKLKEPKTFVTMDDHVKIKPHYRRIWNVIAAPDNKEAGKVKGSGNFPDGTEVTLTVEPNEGFKFLGREGKGIKEEGKEELSTTITVEGDHDIIARFEQDGDGDGGGGGGGGGGGDSDQNQDQNEDQSENQDQNQDQQEQNQDPSEPNEDEGQEQPQDPGEQEEQPSEPEPGEEEPAEPEEGEDPGDQEEQPQDPAGGEDAPSQEAPAGGQPVPLQMTPEEAVRLLEAMEDGEKKLPLFIVTPPDPKKDSKKDW